jgi:formylglycine-generating enzyme required for sulfatase activity
VGETQQNRFGLSDMQGHIWEWCSDWYAERYATGSPVDPRGPESGRMRVIRGGLLCGEVRSSRFAYRCGSEPESRRPDLGFRLARSVDPGE